MQTINLNLIPKGIPDVVNMGQYDVGRTIQLALYDGASPYNVPQDATVQIGGKKGDNHIFVYDDTDGVVSWSGNVVTITSTEQMTAYAGEVLAQLRVVDGDNVLATVNFKMLIQLRPDAEGDISETEIPPLIALAREQEANAAASAEAAALSAQAAALSESNASASATTASNKAGDAAASATTASNKAGEASTSATTASNAALSASGSATAASTSEGNAEAWAKGTKGGTPVSPSDPQYNDNAKYWAGKAQEYAVGGVQYKGSIAFQNIPISGMENGDFYNVTDDFTTDARFAEGAGKYCSAGTNIIWDSAISKWDIAGGLGGVTSFNGRRGDIVPTANDYTADQIQFDNNTSVADELGNKQNKTLDAPITIGDASATTVEGALGALNTAKPDTTDLGSAAFADIPQSGDAAASEVVKGDDTRLTNTRNAADVYAWAKAPTKPTYNASEVGALAVNGKAASASTADEVGHALRVEGSNGKGFEYDGGAVCAIEYVNVRLCVTAAGWSNTVDANGYYTQDVSIQTGSYQHYVDTDKPIHIQITGSADGTRPTAAESAAYNMVDPTVYLADPVASAVRFYTKTKPTSDFYIRLDGVFCYKIG
jgi:hypothetical protein